jgi:hypothetical protein
MKRLAYTLALVMLCLSLTACGVLEYPSYWETDDSFLVNVITVPFEILVTPFIFILKLFPVL